MCRTLELLFYMMCFKSLCVRLPWQKRIHLCSHMRGKRDETCVYSCSSSKDCVSPLCAYSCFYIRRCMLQVNNRACVRAGYSAVLRGHCSSGIRNGETKGVFPGVKYLESKGESEFFQILFICLFLKLSVNVLSVVWATSYSCWKQDMLCALNLFSHQANGGIFGMLL